MLALLELLPFDDVTRNVAARLRAVFVTLAPARDKANRLVLSIEPSGPAAADECIAGQSEVVDLGLSRVEDGCATIHFHGKPARVADGGRPLAGRGGPGRH